MGGPRLVLWVFLLCVTAALPAAAVEITAAVDNDHPRQGEQVLLQVTITGTVRNPGEPVLPELEPDFRVFSSGSSRNISIVNGKMSSSVTYTYVLIPQKQGRLRIGAVTLERKNEVLRTDPIILQVGAPSRPSPGVDPGGMATGSDDIFVRAVIDKDKLYVGEQATLRLQLYTRIQLLETPAFEAPELDGFWRQNLAGAQPRIVTVDGQRYRLLEAALAVFPTRSGRLTIGPARVEATIREERSRRDPFSAFGSIFNGKRVTLETKPLTVEALALPRNEPLGFSGAVGDYVLEARAEPLSVAQGDPVELFLTLSGKGNLHTVSEIPLPDMPGFRVYPETPDIQVKPQGLTVAGTLTQKVLLVPLTAGQQTIPGVRLPVFSPRAKSYETLETKPVEITVTPGNASTGLTGSGRQNVEVVGNDIRFIEIGTPDFRRAGTAGALRVLWWLPLPLAAYAATWWWDRRRRRLDSNQALRRRTRAYKRAKQRLESLPPEAGEAVAVLRDYLADRWNVSGAGLTREDIALRLQEEGRDPDPVIAFLDACDATRFAPGSAGGGDLRVTEEVHRWLRILEKPA